MAFDVSHPGRLPSQAEYQALSKTEREVLFQATLTPADSITFVTHEKVGQPFTYDEYCKAADRERAHRDKMAAGLPQGSTAYFGGVDRYKKSLDSFPSVEDAFQRAKNFQIDLYDKGLAHVDGLLKKNAEGVSDLNVYLLAACVQGYFASGPDQAKANLREVLEFYGSDKTGSHIATQATLLWGLYRGQILDHLSDDHEQKLKEYFTEKKVNGVLQDPSLQNIDETTQAVISALRKNVPTFVDQLATVETSATFQDHGRVVFTDMRDVLAREKDKTRFDHGNWWHLYDFMLNYKTPEAKREFCRQVGISVETMDRALAGEAAPESASPKEKEFAASMQKARWEHKGREMYGAGVKLVICIGLGIAAGYTLGPAMGGIAAASGSAAGGTFDVAEVRGRRERAQAQVVSDLEDTGVGSKAYVASLETEEDHAYGAALATTALSAGTGALIFEGGPLVTGAKEFGKNFLEAGATGTADGRLTDLEYNNERRRLEGNETPYDTTDAVTGVVTNATVAAVFGGAMTVGMQGAPHLVSGSKTRTRSSEAPEVIPRVEVPLEAANNNDGFRTLSFRDLPPERQASLRDIDTAYKKYGDEESLVMMPDGDVIPVPGKFDRAHSTAVKGEQGDGTVQRGRLLAHSQSDTIVPSAEDCRVFLAQAKDRPGEEFVTHITAHAKTPGGDPELLEVRIKYDPATDSFDVQAKATQASIVELDQVDAAFEKAQKDFAKLSPDAQEAARTDMAAMPRIYASRFLSQDPNSAHCVTNSFVNSLQHRLMQSGDPPLYKDQLEILETALWLTYFKNMGQTGKARVNLKYPNPNAGFPNRFLPSTMTEIFKNLGMPVSCVETRLTKNFFSDSPLLSQGKERLTAPNNPFVAKTLHMRKGQFLSPDHQMAAGHSMTVSRFDPETGHLDVVDQLNVGKIETSNWEDISSQQGVELSFYGFYQESSDQLIKISDIFENIDFSALKKQNEVMAKELGYK